MPKKTAQMKKRGERTFSLLQTLQTSRQQLPGLLELTTFEVVLAEEGPNLGAEAEFLARSFVMLFSFLFVELKKNKTISLVPERGGAYEPRASRSHQG